MNEAMEKLRFQVKNLLDECGMAADEYRIEDFDLILDDYAKQIITLIGNAYAQGIVKLPNEVGRENLANCHFVKPTCFSKGLGIGIRWGLPEDFDIIALSPSPQDSVKGE